jgi:hypothetical protein
MVAAFLIGDESERGRVVGRAGHAVGQWTGDRPPSRRLPAGA